MRRAQVLAAGLLAASLASAAAAARPPHDLLVRNAQLIDGTDAPPRDGVRWTIRDGEARTPAEWMAEP